MLHQQDTKRCSFQATAPNPNDSHQHRHSFKEHLLLCTNIETNVIKAITETGFSMHNVSNFQQKQRGAHAQPDTDTLLQGKDREAMLLQLSNWHCSSSASTQKEPHRAEKACVLEDAVILFICFK